jgi:chromate transporter
MKEYIELVWIFLKIGASSFGGGYAIVPVLKRELVDDRGWLKMEDIADYYTFAQVTPGIIAVNVSTFVGYRRKGCLGGILATLAFVIPGITFVTIISLFISGFAEYPAVRHAFAGIRIAVGALVLNTVLSLVKGFYKDAKGLAVFAIIFALSVALAASPVYLVAGAGFLGYLLYWRRKRPVER